MQSSEVPLCDYCRSALFLEYYSIENKPFTRYKVCVVCFDNKDITLAHDRKEFKKERLLSCHECHHIIVTPHYYGLGNNEPDDYGRYNVCMTCFKGGEAVISHERASLSRKNMWYD
jgi:hypothetical protein